ncbi:hypothetical protein E3U55_15360 [Filobacillus milosensis]|uniref:Uncharacterized protein n=1 Tax=Filobacillus milosensis TaxID=94137 RepID=A0A4Y8ID08_9BACI|nr:hypothetical protein E3U55_15360 [Filobacillus milosensis]
MKRIPDELPQKIVQTIFVLSFLYPYYILLDAFPNTNFTKYIQVELELIPWVLLSYYLGQKTWRTNQNVMNLIQSAILVIVAAAIVFDALMSNTIYDALIVGGLSLIAILIGFIQKIKSFFLVGVSVLLLNVMIQSRPFWGNLPWWAYLLIAGSTLIAVASFYEWQKQKVDRDGDTFLQKQKTKWIKIWKNWN